MAESSAMDALVELGNNIASVDLGQDYAVEESNTCRKIPSMTAYMEQWMRQNRMNNVVKWVLLGCAPHNVSRIQIYDLDSVIARLNAVTRPFETGAFHAGVEVFGWEYGYGRTDEPRCGLTKNSPMRHPVHVWREEFVLGPTALSEESVRKLLRSLADEWRGDDYNILTRNCTHFCEEFCKLLSVGPFPPFLMNLAKSAHSTMKSYENFTHSISNLGKNFHKFNKKTFSRIEEAVETVVDNISKGLEDIPPLTDWFAVLPDPSDDDEAYWDVQSSAPKRLS
ncbi:MAG: hypothetical protein KVP17_000030, partial [Porospora cf. gigantea B]|uniref:uncharacterized protein n=1 Tax=Porospora cf. gigantea B TaxID=2853592 RepID=UPI003571EF8C